jgi:hypothetical protein
MSQKIKGAGGINANLSPDAFHRWATHYYKCKQDFRSPSKFSPVPYFLLCRAIELEIKSIHLRVKKQEEVKHKFQHRILNAYEALSEEHKILDDNEVKVLKVANNIYSSKGFEYFKPQDALTGYSRFPDLDTLDTVAKKLINHNTPDVSSL